MVFHKTSSRKLYCGLIALVALAFCFLAPRIPQDPAYHLFAGTDTLWNVVSNVPFVVIGGWALATGRARGAEGRVAAVGVLLTGFGSAYYHAAPSNPTLVWDRLPMTLVFMALLAMVLDVWAGWRRLLWPLIVLGIGSVVWWSFTDDLRWYAAVQFGPVLILVPAAVSDARVRPLWKAGAAYGAAKLLEAVDRPLYDATGIAGHPLKHLAAALAAYWVLRWMARETHLRL